MTSSPAIVRCSDFSHGSRGKLVNRLLIGSFAVSTISFGLSMARFGFASVLVIPAAFGVMFIHHITIWCLLAKYKKSTTIAKCWTPPFLKHAGHIWPLFLLSVMWFGGGLTAICVIAVSYGYSGDRFMDGLDIVDVTSGTLALLAGIIDMTLLVVCWRALSREGYDGIHCACGNTHTGGDPAGIPMNNLVHGAPSTTPGYDGEGTHDADSVTKLPL
ncbi:hypothetical protein RhiJN_17085 [Ceratobasidium sp. AG-Ba]|nr:hypothetical protein RhiJN_17085 [Ceratobasidium sp. AG-Ba]